MSDSPAMLGVVAYGRSAARLGRASRAAVLSKEGASPRRILLETGYQRGPYGWGVETRGDVYLKPASAFGARPSGTLEEMADVHPDVERAYPGIGRELRVEVVPDNAWADRVAAARKSLALWASHGDTASGFYDRGNHLIAVRAQMPGETMNGYIDRADGTVTHEVQHYAQERDGLRPAGPRRHVDADDYREDGLEVDARNSAARRKLTPEERREMPRAMTQDVKPEDVRRDEKGGDNFGTFRNFLATDDVPETIFGIPVVQDESQYTEKDLEFFRKNPKAAGFYDLGDDGEMEEDVPRQALGAEGTAPQLTEQQQRAIAGGPRRQWATAYEDALDVRPVIQQNGVVTWQVYPKLRGDGVVDAAGYRRFKGKTDGKWHLHTNTKPMSLDQWTENADVFDAEADTVVGKILGDFGLDASRVPQVTKDTLWDMAFISGLDDKKGIRGVLRDSHNLHATFDRLVNSTQLTREEAFDLALLSELDTYHSGNHRRVMARASRLADAISESSSPDRTPYRSVGETFGAAVAHGTRGTAEEREFEGFKTRMRNVKMAVEDVASGGDGRLLWRKGK